jgi:large subunit ribosomal protein L9
MVMDIILLKDVAKVGRKFEAKTVSDGYALNFLIAKGLAREATPRALRALQSEKEKHEASKSASQESLIKSLSALKDTPVEISAKANDEGVLFAAMHADEVVTSLKNVGVEVDADMLQIPQIKKVGTYKIPVVLDGAEGEFTLLVVTA